MANTRTTISEALGAPAPRERIAEANHRIANELGQLAALLTKQINSVARGPDLLCRQSALKTLSLHHGRLLGISRLHRATSRQPDQDHVLAEHCLLDAAQASAITLAFSEIVTNAMKYAHPTGLPVEMTVSATPASDGTVALSISDDGIGLPEDFVESRDAGVGLKLVRSLVESVGGRMAMSSTDLGLAFRIEFSRSSAPQRAWGNE